MSGRFPNGWRFHPCDADKPRGTRACGQYL